MRSRLNRNLRSGLFAGVLAGAVLLVSPAQAGETEDRDAAIAACRAAIAADAGVPATRQFVDFHQSETRPGIIHTRFRVRSQPGGDRWEAQCDFRRRVGEVASVSQQRPESQRAAN